MATTTDIPALGSAVFLEDRFEAESGVGNVDPATWRPTRIRATGFGYSWRVPASQTVDDEQGTRLLAAAARRALRRALDEDA